MPSSFPLVDVVVDNGTKQVVCRGHSMKIAGEMQVYVLHWKHLRVAAAGGSAFNAEHRAERRLAQSDYRAFAQFPQRLTETDRGRCLALRRPALG